MLDIMLKGDRDGIDLGCLIRDRYKIPFIFLTSYSDRETVQRARSVLPDGYLLKPFTDKDLFTAIEIAIFRNSYKSAASEEKKGDSLNAILHDCIFIRKDYLLVKIKFNDLFFIKSEGNYLELFCSGNKKHLIRSTLKDFLNRLPASVFLQVHKSYAVNINHIEAIEYSQLLIGSTSIPIGRLFTENIRRTLHIDF